MDIPEEVEITDLLGVNIDKVNSETYHLSQSKLINQIVSNMGLSNSDTTPRTSPAVATNILSKYQDVEKSNQHFHYCIVIGKLN